MAVRVFDSIWIREIFDDLLLSQGGLRIHRVCSVSPEIGVLEAGI